MRRLGLFILLSNVIWMAACGGNGGSSSGGGTNNPPPTGNNVLAITVDSGAAPQQFITANVAFANITVCVPGTSQCQTIDHVQVDTGSQGLRLLSGVLTLSLPAETDSNNNPLDECLPFADGYVWGPVQLADITMGGEKASNTPIQVMIPSTSSPPVPASCSSQNPPGGNGDEGGSVMALGANGIVGVGLFAQDCGIACTSQNQTIPDRYYSCPGSGCVHTYATLQQQLQNPVSVFSSDNNGVLIQLPAVPNGGSATVNGSLVFGIGTQSNNALGSATVYDVDSQGDFTTVYHGNSYSGSFIDSGSNGFFFPDSSIPTCPHPNESWYCPTTSPDNLSAGNQGTNMNSPITVNFSIEKATTLFNGNNTAFSTLGGPVPANLNAFDWGLSFFFGRNVFTAIENKSTPGGTGPYFAY